MWGKYQANLAQQLCVIMRLASMRLFVATVGATLLLPASFLAPVPASAQSADPKAAPQPKPKAENDGQKKIDEFAEAAQRLGGPAANPECVWLGRRVVSLLWRDDLDTAFRHLDLYDRFGCPAGHIQATFRCLVRQGNIDPKQPETLNGRVHACWINPEGDAAAAVQAAPTQAPAPAAAAPSTTESR
jgi:hypothetical protein